MKNKVSRKKKLVLSLVMAITLTMLGGLGTFALFNIQELEDRANQEVKDFKTRVIQQASEEVENYRKRLGDETNRELEAFRQEIIDQKNAELNSICEKMDSESNQRLNNRAQKATENIEKARKEAQKEVDAEREKLFLEVLEK